MATIYEFGPFRLETDAEMLFRDAEPIVLGRRAVALLRVLLERAGTPVAKDALMEAAWPGLAIEESNLTVQIAALRRVFANAGGKRPGSRRCRGAATAMSDRQLRADPNPGRQGSPFLGAPTNHRSPCSRCRI